MFLASRLLNLKISRVVPLRQCSQYKTKMYMKVTELAKTEPVDEMIKKYAPRLIYNSEIERKVIRFDYLNSKTGKHKRKPVERHEEPLPVSLRFLDDEIKVKEEETIPETDSSDQFEQTIVNFPYDASHTVEETHEEPTRKKQQDNEVLDVASKAREEVQKRYETYKDMKNWMVSYDNYDDSCLLSDDSVDITNPQVNYGTPDPRAFISNTPCGGCGALLHCKDTAIPGYIPSEIFKNNFKKGGSNLEAVICQRCHFLKHYNVALQVQVTPEDYPKVLSTIAEREGMVILMVDLLDFPCSIWPGIGEIFGNRVPIVIVGNKVDLLPQDSPTFLNRIRQTLLDYVKLQGFGSFYIKDVALISAKTGYGVENLITKLNSLNDVKGDVYIVGCTNVGKSSLFNAFLQSDYCKIQALDLIQRATTSVWPGTTLNLLSFPIKRPHGYRQYLRHKRLQVLERIEAEENSFRKEQLRKSRDPKYATLVGRIDITRNPDSGRKRDTGKQLQPNDLFMVRSQGYDNGITEMGVNENHKAFKYSKWCYDTPGVVQPDQLIHLLTTDELLLTLPKELIIPRAFCIQPNTSLFIAGLARLDYVEGEGSAKLIVFASKELPITVCGMEEADAVYQELLGTNLFKVPIGAVERISKWPQLEADKEFVVTGERWRKSVKDVVLSSAGWISLTGRKDLKYTFRAWTPEKRGIYVRDCLLPYAVDLMGSRIRHSVCYHKYRFYV